MRPHAVKRVRRRICLRCGRSRSSDRGLVSAAAATTTAAAAAVTTTAATVSAATTAGTLFLRLGFVHVELTPAVFGAVETGDRGLRLGVGAHLDKAKALA